jgi:hypothetical protein
LALHKRAQRLDPVAPEAAMHHEQFHACIQACNDCAAACDVCAAACLQERDISKLARCIALDFDCAQICRLASAFLSRGSESAVDACDLCARICDACGDQCDRHDSAHCRECAAACRRCAEECRAMASQGRRQLRGAATAAAR